MSEYAKKTCYDCGIRKPANYMERVTESYTSGQSNTKVTAGNLVFGALGDKRGQNAVGRAIKGNNRRSYTRNRTVWKCLDCSGHNDAVANQAAYDKLKASGAIKMPETVAILGTCAGLLWVLFFLFCWVFLEFLLDHDINDTFMWVNGVGSFMFFGYFMGKYDEIQEAVEAERNKQ